MIRFIVAILLALAAVAYRHETDGLSLGLFFIAALICYWVGVEDGAELARRKL